MFHFSEADEVEDEEEEEVISSSTSSCGAKSRWGEATHNRSRVSDWRDSSACTASSCVCGIGGQNE
jgi:hypothetical protein